MGTTSISQGTLELASETALQNSVVIVSNGATLAFAASSEYLEAITSGTQSLSNPTNGSPVTLVIGSGGSSSSFSGMLTGNGTLVKAGSGTLTLTGTNTFTGGLVLDPGVVSIADDAALGARPGSAIGTA